VVLQRISFLNTTPLIVYDKLICKGNPEVFGNGYKLIKEAHNAFLEITKEALKSDIELKATTGPNRVPEIERTHADRKEKIREAIHKYKNAS
jgi:hypothetical protein